MHSGISKKLNRNKCLCLHACKCAYVMCMCLFLWVCQRGCCCFPCSDSNKQPSHVSCCRSSSHVSHREEHTVLLLPLTGNMLNHTSDVSRLSLCLCLPASDSSLPLCCLTDVLFFQLFLSLYLGNFLFPESFSPLVSVRLFQCTQSVCESLLGFRFLPYMIEDRIRQTPLTSHLLHCTSGGIKPCWQFCFLIVKGV